MRGDRPRMLERSHTAPQRGAFLVSQANRVKIGVEIFFSLVVSRDFVVLAAFFMQPHPPAFPLLVISSTFIPTKLPAAAVVRDRAAAVGR
jgi:hypothetical protein